MSGMIEGTPDIDDSGDARPQAEVAAEALESTAKAGDPVVETLPRQGSAESPSESSREVEEASTPPSGPASSGAASSTDLLSETVANLKTDSKRPASPLPGSLFERREKEGDRQVAADRKFTMTGSRLHPVPVESLKRVERLYRPPPTIERFHTSQRTGRQFCPEKRILLIAGPMNSGRYSSALWLGLEALKTAGSRACFEYRVEVSLFDELLDHVEQRGPAAYIVQNAIPLGPQWEAFSDEHLKLLASQLKTTHSYLLLTCPLDIDGRCRHAESVEFLDVGIPEDVRPVYLHKVVEGYLRYYDQGEDASMYGIDLDEELHQAIQELEASQDESHRISGRLTTPPQVDVFFRRLLGRGLSRAADGKPGPAILKLAEEVASASRQAVRQWFLDLPLNHKLYALLIGLFPRINRFLLDELYANVVQSLRQEGVRLYDFREDNVESLFEALHVIPSVAGETLELEDRYAREIQQQLVNYYHLLWSAIPVAREWIKQFKHPDQWELRQNLGRGIGRMGIHQWPKLVYELHEMAEGDGYVAAVAGYALQGIIDLGREQRDLNRLGYVLGLFHQWARSDDPNHVWTAAAAAWRCYPGLARLEREEAVQGLPAMLPTGSSDRASEVATPAGERSEMASMSAADAIQQLELVLEAIAVAIARMTDPEVCWMCRSSLIAAVSHIFDQEPDRAVRLLCRWMNGGTPPADDANLSWEDAQDAGREEKREVAGRPSRTAEVEAVLAASSDSRQPEAKTEEDATQADGDAEDAEDTPGDGSKPSSAERDQVLRPFALIHFGLATSIDLLDRHRKPERMEARKHGALLRLIRPILHLTDDDLDETAAGDDFQHQYGEVQQVVDRLMEVVRGWLTNEQWDERVYGELLRALNRSRLGPRRRFCRNLTNYWLKNDRPRIRQIAEALLARAQIIDGMAVDAPGGSCGVLCLDGSLAARFNDTGPDAGFQLYERLRAQSDLTVAVLGHLRPLARPGDDLSHDQFRATRSLPRLLLPLLEQTVPERTHYVLVLAWGALHDLTDIADPSFADWWDKLLLRTTEQRAGESKDWLGVLLIQPLNHFHSEKERRRIQDDVNGILQRSLALRTAEQWRQVMQPHLPPDMPLTPSSVQQHLSGLSQQLDHIPDATQGGDLARRIGCGILWLAAWNARAAVELLETWIAAPQEAPQPPLGCSYTLMILKILLSRPVPRPTPARKEPAEPSEFRGFRRRDASADTQQTDTRPASDPRVPAPAPPLPPVEEYGVLLRLAPLLASAGYGHGVARLLEWVRCWVHDPAWGRRFADQRAGGELFQMLDKSPRQWQLALLHRFQEWEEPREHWGEQMAPPQARHLAAALRRYLLVGPPKTLPALLPDEGLLVILIDTALPESTRRRRYAKIAEKMLQQFAKRSREFPKLRIAVYRLGERAPAVVPGERASADTIVPPPLPASPRLAAPLLEDLPQAQVHRIVLFADRLPHDAAEWLGDWKTNATIYSDSRKTFPQESAWERVGPLKKPPAAAAKEIIERITTFLRGTADED
jgi:hypothetical protein